MVLSGISVIWFVGFTRALCLDLDFGGFIWDFAWVDASGLVFALCFMALYSL